MITKGDDYPLHQTPDPIAYTGANRNFYDRYFFNGYNRSGDVFFAAALGVYPYVNIMDAAFSITYNGIQHNVYASKIMHMERMATQVGAIEIEIVKPLEVLRIICNDLENGIKADLTFTANTHAHEEPRFMRRSGSQTVMDVTRMMQNGSWRGWVEVKGYRIEVNPSEFRGTRDRSWGIRSIGDADPQPNPYAVEPQFYWLWAPLCFDDFSTHFFLNDDAEGIAWNGNAVILEKDNVIVNQMKTWKPQINFESGTRTAKSAEITCVDRVGETWHFELKPKWNFSMKGIGYGHDKWKHGAHHGELAGGYDEFVVAEISSSDIHVQAICDVKLTSPNGVYHGQGVLEQLIVGPHKPSGFNALMDLAS